MLGNYFYIVGQCWMLDIEQILMFVSNIPIFCILYYYFYNKYELRWSLESRFQSFAHVGVRVLMNHVTRLYYGKSFVAVISTRDSV